VTRPGDPVLPVGSVQTEMRQQETPNRHARLRVSLLTAYQWFLSGVAQAGNRPTLTYEDREQTVRVAEGGGACRLLRNISRRCLVSLSP
jgi:hypothetical protein